MRILAQNGMSDLPYESIGICINYHTKNEIIAYPAGTYSPDDEYWTLARYSTENKAKKAMEMLREAYCGVIHVKCGDYEVEDIGLSQEMEKKIREEMSKIQPILMVPNNPSVECKIFQFPSDEDVED